MNYVIFTSIGIFVALFLIVSSHFGVSPKSPADFSPKKIAKVIRAEQRKNVMIAKEKYGIGITLNPIQIAGKPDDSKPILPASVSIPKRKKESLGSHLFSGDGLYSLVKEAVKSVFSSEK